MFGNGSGYPDQISAEPGPLSAGVPQPPQPQGPGPQYGVPQPPMGQPQAAPMPTLGTANDAILPPGNPITQQYVDAIGSTLNMLQQRGFIQPPIPPPPPKPTGQRLLEGLATFGISELKHIADENTRREQNYVRAQQNRAIGLKGVDLATKMVDTQAMAGLTNARFGLQLQGLNLQQQKFISDMVEKQLRDAQAEKDRTFKRTMRPAPTSIDAARQMRAEGWTPSADNPAFWEQQGGGGGGGGPRLTKNPATGAYELPAPGSPALTTLNAVGGGGTDTSSTPLPGEAPEETAARLKRADVIATKAGSQAATNTATLSQTIAQLRGELEPMRAAVGKVLPSLGQGGIARGLGTTYVGGPVSLMHARYSTDPAMRDAAKTIQSSGRNIFNLIKSEAGGTTGLRITNPEIQQFGKQFNAISSGQASLEDAQSYIDNLSDFLDRRDPAKGAQSTTTTPGSTLAGTPPTSSTAPTSLESLLQKHGY